MDRMPVCKRCSQRLVSFPHLFTAALVQTHVEYPTYFIGERFIYSYTIQNGGLGSYSELESAGWGRAWRTSFKMTL
jgi:hypothetical protein